MSVEQSGNVTNGHLAKWITNGVIGDAGPPAVGQRVLATLFDADFNSIADQPILIPDAITAFQLTSIVVTNSLVSLTLAVGGFYPQASKAGSPIVAAGQVYSTLTGPNLLLNPTRTAFAQTARFSSANLPDLAIYLSLTTAQGVPVTADVYLVGIDLTA